MKDERSNGKMITHTRVMMDNPGQQPQPTQVSLMPDGRDGSTVYARPVRPGEESEGLWVEDGETLVVRVEVSHIFVEGETEPVRVREEEREGSTIFVRRLGQGEIDTGETIKFIPEEEKLVLTQAVPAIGLFMTPEVGRKDDLLTWVRIVPDGRDGSTVYGRTLHHGEPDTGQAVQLRPGDSLTLRAGAVSFSLDGIDDAVAVAFDDGYTPITNTLWTWLSFCLSIGANIPEDSFRFLLAAGRRLDESHRMLMLVRTKLNELQMLEDAIPQRNLIYEIVGMVEMAIIAMNRALYMASQLRQRFQLSTCFPVSVTGKLNAIKAIRDAYEHIDERALGLAGIKPKPHADALSVFDFKRLFQDRTITYGSHDLDLDNEVTQLLIDTRQYLKMAASELAELQQTPS